MNHVEPSQDTAPEVSATMSPGAERKILQKLGIIAFLLVAAVGIIAVVLLFQSNRMTDVTQENLDAAVELWENARSEIDGYSATIEVEGGMPGVYRISVSSGEVESVTFNDSPLELERTRAVWTVEGMHEMVDLDLHRKQQLAQGGNNTFVTRASFDPEFGYPKKYVRFDYGTKQTVTWTVTSFVVRR